jgi:hypothetical protein
MSAQWKLLGVRIKYDVQPLYLLSNLIKILNTAFSPVFGEQHISNVTVLLN